MPFDSGRHHRHSIRKAGYDYTLPGAYFVTVCSRGKVSLFGDISGDVMQLNQIGHLITMCWLALPRLFPFINLDEWILMPNHLHAIIVIAEHGSRVNAQSNTDTLYTRVNTEDKSPKPAHGAVSGSLAAVISNFKSISTRKVNANMGNTGSQIWQRGYYDRIIRNAVELDAIRRYIRRNPANWARDADNPLI